MGHQRPESVEHGRRHADYGLLITRTDPDVPKHKGLTAFWLKMDTPGLEVRPIKTMGGDFELNEVFLDDVRIPDDQRVGEVNGGWSVVLAPDERARRDRPDQRAQLARHDGPRARACPRSKAW